MDNIFGTDNQIDLDIDRQLDDPILQLTPTTRKSRVFSIPYTGPIPTPIPPVGLPNINVATTQVIEVTNYSVLNGLYTKGYDPSIGNYFLRDDFGYYVWWNPAGGAGYEQWQFESLSTYQIIATRTFNSSITLPAEGWLEESFLTPPIPLQILFVS